MMKCECCGKELDHAIVALRHPTEPIVISVQSIHPDGIEEYNYAMEMFKSEGWTVVNICDGKHKDEE